MDHLPTIRQLQYLSALAEHHSFSKAAAHCHVTQSTLSAGIKDLEELLGRPVVDRSRKKIVLTSFGKAVWDEAQSILGHAREIGARARALAEPLSGPLRMGIIPTIAPYLLPEILPRLQTRFPALALQLKEDQSARILEDLRSGGLDLILLAFPYDTPGMTQTLLFEEPFSLACPAGTWDGHNPAHMDDLEDKELLLLEEGHCLRDHALAACKFRTKTGREIFNATSLPTLIQFVQHGYGMTMLPRMAIEGGAIAETIDIIPFQSPPPTRQIGLAWRRSHPQEDEFRLLAEAIRNNV